MQNRNIGTQKPTTQQQSAIKCFSMYKTSMKKQKKKKDHIIKAINCGNVTLLFVLNYLFMRICKSKELSANTNK